MAITWGAIQEIVRSSVTTNTWSDDVTATASDSTILVLVLGGTNLSTDSPGIVTLTINGVDVTVEGIGGGGTNVRPWVAIGHLHNVPAGTHTLNLVTANNNRWMEVYAVEFFDLDQSATIGASGALGGSSNHSDASFTDTTLIDGSVHLSGLMIESPMEGDLSATGGATLLIQKQTGANSSSDGTGAVAIELVATAGADGHGVSWITADRRGFFWVRLNPATGAGTGTGTAAIGIVLASSVTGVALIAADSVGALVISSTAAASSVVDGSAASSLVIGSSAAASVAVVSSASAALVIGSSATAAIGDVPVTGGASASLVLASSAVASVEVAGDAVGALVIGSSATAEADIAAEASSSLVITSSSSGVAPASGSASAGLVLGSSAFGGVSIIGAASAGITLGATATGSVANAPTIDHIILAGFRRPGYRAPGGEPSSHAPGGRGRARTVGGGA